MAASRPIRSWPALACAGLLLWVLAGCATNPDAPGSQGRDLVTDSDEPDTRKRARIRLELAVGYFEEGKTTIALDELKLSLAADPDFGPAHMLRGLIYMRLNDARLAEESFRRALVLMPRDGDVLHNYGWLLCQQNRHAEAVQQFGQALANPQYAGRAKTLMVQGLCQIRANQRGPAEESLRQSYELDPANPVTGYNLAYLHFRRGDYPRAQFLARRINNSDQANAESLWLGIRVERRMGNPEAAEQLSTQLRRRFPQSREAAALERGAFDE